LAGFTTQDNRYMNWCLRHWKRSGAEQKFAARLVTYADDFVIVSRGKASEALAWAKQVMKKLKLEIDETKTCVRNARREQFDFLGVSFGLHTTQRHGMPYLGASA
jgi:RNA-directed DNA polymerase